MGQWRHEADRDRAEEFQLCSVMLQPSPIIRERNVTRINIQWEKTILALSERSQ